MSLEGGQPLPLYGKLLLENKILVFFACLLLLLGGGGLYAQHWVTGRVAEQETRSRLESALDDIIVLVTRSVASADSAQLSSLLERAAMLDAQIAYLTVEQGEGAPLAVVARSPDVAAMLASRRAGGGEPEARGTPHRRDHRPGERVGQETGAQGSSQGTALARSGATEWNFLELDLPLVVDAVPIGTLRVGVERAHIDRLSTTAVAIVAAIMLLPAVLVLLSARAVVRQAVRPLKKLTEVADAISTGHLDPLIDFGVHVNCWELKNCQRTDCQAYMNFDQQCWYIDGTPCEGYESRFPQKLFGCRTCDVYQAHRGDEIVQLADAFKHMTGVLKASREDLVKSGDFQQRLIRNSFNGIVAADADDTISIFNRVAEELLGVSREEVIGLKSWKEFFKDGLERSMDLPLSHERIRRVRGFAPRELAIRRADGEEVDVLLSGISLFERGMHIGKVFFFQDLRELKRLREDLIRSERLAATGQAAAGISHSIRNILDGLRGGTYVFKAGTRRGDEETMQKGWEMIERNTEIISNLVKDLLNFAKERSPEYQEVQPAALIESVVSGLNLDKESRVQVQTEIDEHAGTISLDLHTFQQCLLNLIRNATEAIPEDRQGRVKIRFKAAGDKAIFAVEDDGVGMSPAVLEKVKGGMFSTKGSKGTGLGLLVSQKIVNEHAGTLTIESEEGEGSTFWIEIPADGRISTV